MRRARLSPFHWKFYIWYSISNLQKALVLGPFHLKVWWGGGTEDNKKLDNPPPLLLEIICNLMG